MNRKTISLKVAAIQNAVVNMENNNNDIVEILLREKIVDYIMSFGEEISDLQHNLKIHNTIFMGIFKTLRLLNTQNVCKQPVNIISDFCDTIVTEYYYKDIFKFKRNKNDDKWYVTNELDVIITSGNDRNKLEEWIINNHI